MEIRLRSVADPLAILLRPPIILSQPRNALKAFITFMSRTGQLVYLVIVLLLVDNVIRSHSASFNHYGHMRHPIAI